jgi:hypothetical protein
LCEIKAISNLKLACNCQESRGLGGYVVDKNKKNGKHKAVIGENSFIDFAGISQSGEKVVHPPFQSAAKGRFCQLVDN